MPSKSIIPMPAVGLLCGSVTSNRNEHQIRYDLVDNPRKFFDKIVKPFIDDGVTKVMHHRLFGEFTMGDTHMDYDSWMMMLESNDPKMRDYAQRATHAIVKFYSQYPDVQPVLYLGSIGQPRLKKMIDQGNVTGWLQRIARQIELFDLIGKQYGVKFRFVFDFVSSFAQSSPEWHMFQTLRSLYPGRIEMESTPSPNNREQWGLPSWVAEGNWQHPSRVHRQDPKLLGKVTRWLMGPTTLREVWGNKIHMFILDCHTKGHECCVGDDLVRRMKTTLSAERAKAQDMLDKKTGAK